MAWPTIDPTTPLGTEKIKFGDERIREAKQHIVDGLQAISNYTAGGTTPAIKTAVWTTATRPTGGDLVDGVTGYNTTLGCEEYYDLATTTWVAKNPPLAQWTTTTRPATPYTGQYGHCTDLDVMERYSGSAWVRVNSPARGVIQMWSGSVANIPTGWVLADNSSQTIDGATFTVPDLRSRFIVGAGADTDTYVAGTDAIGTGYYAPGASGGQDKHTLVTSETPKHRHSWTLYGDCNQPGGYPTGESSAGGSTGTGYTSYIGSDGAHENRPPYYALCFLYKL